MAVNRIHIVGNCGSGKTYLADKLARHLLVPVCNLDDIYWDNASGKQGQFMPEDIRDQNLAAILQKQSWVIEGIYYKWLAQSFAAADVIIIIEPANWIRNLRLVKRFIKGQLGLVNNKNETLKSFIALVKWAQPYSKTKIPEIIEMTEPYKAKRFFFKNADEAFEFMTSSCIN